MLKEGGTDLLVVSQLQPTFLMHLTVPGLFNKWGRSSPTTPTGSSDDTKDLLKAFNLTGQVDKGENCYGGGGEH